MVGDKLHGIVLPRVSDQVIIHQSAELEACEDKSPAPQQRAKLGDVGEAGDDGARGTPEPGGACATRPGESMKVTDELFSSVATDTLNDRSPALQQRAKLGDVDEADDDGARGTLEPGGACATRAWRIDAGGG